MLKICLKLHLKLFAIIIFVIIDLQSFEVNKTEHVEHYVTE